MAKSKFILDEFHYHEAIDRTWVITDMMDTYLLAHPVINKNKKLKNKVQQAQHLLLDVYQIIGNLEPQK